MTVTRVQMYECNKCGAVFSEDEFPTIDGEVSAVYAGGEKIHGDKKPEVIEQCPKCRSEDFTDVYECEYCGEYTPLLHAKDGKGGPAICGECARDFEVMVMTQADNAEMHGLEAHRDFYYALSIWADDKYTEIWNAITERDE